MNCPVDHEVRMVTISVDGVTLDRCGKCGGHWLDHGELAKLAHREEAVEPVATITRGSTRFCPKDASPLTEVEFPTQSGLKIDVCPECQGIWLDAYELGQALTLLGRPNQPEGIGPERPVIDLLARLTRKRTF